MGFAIVAKNVTSFLSHPKIIQKLRIGRGLVDVAAFGFVVETVFGHGAMPISLRNSQAPTAKPKPWTVQFRKRPRLIPIKVPI